ncbi:hypothetical protein [Pseudoalteromonas xiamenensis]
MNNLDKVYFKSRAVGKLSSQSLNELKSTLRDIESGRSKLEKDIGFAEKQLKQEKSDLAWINWFPLKLVLKNKIKIKKDAITKISENLKKLAQDYERHKLGLDVSLSEQLEAAFGTLDDRFSDVLGTQKVWDITTSQSIDRVAERTTANNVLNVKRLVSKE